MMTDETPFIWHELVTADQHKSGTFFCELMGCQARQVDAGEFGTYTLFIKDGKEVAGMMNPTADTPGAGSCWHAYIAVDDVDHCAQRALELGGKVLVPVHQVPDVGRICVIADPLGAVTHLMQPQRAGGEQ
jgi:predicted enzyme related to lactoylglutathione lyase